MEQFAQSSICERLYEDGIYVGTTAGTSMWPLLRNRRDTVVIHKNPGRLVRGQVALYRKPSGQYVLHRVLGYKDGCYHIRGDNTYALEIVPDDGRVIGYLAYCIRGKKTVRPESRGYRCYVCLWQMIYPIRLCVYQLRRLMGRIYRMIFRRDRTSRKG